MSVAHQRWVVVDDTDSNIQYTGPWFADTSGSQDNTGYYGPSYQSTLHGTKQDASLSFAFTGSKVTIFGSNNRVNNSGTFDPTWNCFVDGVATGPTAYFQSPENNWVFCDQDQLSDGQHVITVNATVTSGHTFWFDQIQYVPSASDDLSQDAILVDNLDGALQYGSGWGAFGETANMTTITNSIFTFEWTGVSLSWYGFIPNEFPLGQTTANYSIDGGSSTTFLLKGIPPETSTLYNQKFFQTPNLPAGQHKIVVTYLGNGQVTPLMLDYLIVQNGSVPSTLSSSGGGSSSGGLNSGLTSGSTASQSVSAYGISASGPATSGASTSRGSNSSKSSNTGPIVGGIVSVLVLVVVFLFYRRRNRKLRLNTAYGNGGSGPQANFVEPFQYLPPTNAGSGRSGYQVGYGPYPYTSEKARREAEVVAAQTNVTPLRSVRPGQVPQQQRLQPRTPMMQQGVRSPPFSNDSNSRLVVHEDSGIRLPSHIEGLNVVEVPPVYTLG